jgi:hypothetical protein
VARSPWIISVLPKRLKPAGVRLFKAYGKTTRRIDRFVAKWFPAPKGVAFVPIEQFLHHAHMTLLALQRRQYLLEALDAEWPAITRGKSYWIHDDATFRAIGDVETMNIVDLCSWGIGASDTDEALLLRVKNHYLSELPILRWWGLDDDRPALDQLYDESHAQARARLFPKAAGRALVETDADHLVDSFEKRIQALRQDRNRNRAHAYESKTTQGDAKRLEPAEVRQLYTYARQILNDLCLVALGKTWTENDLNPNNVKLTAEDLLDIVFLPNWFRRETAGLAMSRVEIYDALHADASTGHFNDAGKLERLADRLAASSAQLKS